MTSCGALQLRLAAYGDDELGVDAALEIERHLAACAACRREVGRQRHLSHALATLYPNVDLPAGLEARVRNAALGPRWPRRTVTAAAIAASLVAVAGVSAWLGRVTADAPEPTTMAALQADANEDAMPAVTAAATLHRRVDDGEVGLDLVSHDVNEVNDWLRTALPLAGSITPPGSPVITLEGATRVTVGGHPAGLVRYRMNGRELSLFLLAQPAWSAEPTSHHRAEPASDHRADPIRVGNVDFRVFQRRGLDLVGWSHAPLSYLLVSEDGLTSGEACMACHTGDARGSIADFVAAVAGRTAGT